ncbi:MAG: hypothetical protein K2W82_07970 [Candidatus Obscuribacterales bacterium]|nr:hypothetical protein [Candidatus Obscuribacterales bacterium]
MFRDRLHAGNLLGEALKKILTQNGNDLDTVIIALPRGGVPVARQIAENLSAPLSILVSKKIGAPYQPELALGAVSSTGVVVLNETLGIINDQVHPYIKTESNRLIDDTKTLQKRWLDQAGLSENQDLKNKQVILVDDGVATGMTTLAALRSLKELGALRTILATPIIASDARKRLENECDLIVGLENPNDFEAVGQFYMDFHQVDDTEMIKALTWN